MDNKKRLQLPSMQGPPPPPHSYRQPPHGQYHPHQHPMMIMAMPPGARGPNAPPPMQGRGRPGHPPPPPHGYGHPPHHRHPYNPPQGMIPMIPMGMHPQHGGPRGPPRGPRGPLPQIPSSMNVNGPRGNNGNPNMQQQQQQQRPKNGKPGIPVSNSMGKVKHPFVKKATGIKWTTEEVRAVVNDGLGSQATGLGYFLSIL